MKLLFSALLILISMTSFGQDLQKIDDVKNVEFSTLSRGGHYEKIVITKDKLLFQKERRRSNEETQSHTRVVKNKEWKQVIQSLAHLNLDDIRTLESPSMKRAFDGARHSEMIITTFDNRQYIHRFDDEIPNEQLKPLLQAILGMNTEDD